MAGEYRCSIHKHLRLSAVSADKTYQVPRTTGHDDCLLGVEVSNFREIAREFANGRLAFDQRTRRQIGCGSKMGPIRGKEPSHARRTRTALHVAAADAATVIVDRCYLR